MFIEDEQIEQAIDMIKGHMIAHQEEMETAFAESDPEEDNALDVSLKVKFEAAGNGILIKTAMSFSKGKIVEKDKRLTYPKQKPLEGMK